MDADAPNAGVGSYRPPVRRALLVLYLAIAAFLFLVAIAGLHPQIAVSSLTRDMAAIANVHPLTGVVSNVGILLWCAAAAICFFSSSLLRRQGAQPEARFLMWAGLMTTGLLVDDFFLFHEYLAPVHLGFNEKAVHASYVCVTVAYLLSHRHLILETNYRLLAAALVLFAGSILLDVAGGHGWWVLAEDGCKLFGISTWFAYHAATARHWLVQSPALRNPQTNSTPEASIFRWPLRLARRRR
ncbi:MAG TPA: hypothetical protein VFU13_14225 [Steroidobacteraceae bacterium]|nr:hypothetical protein [Steroidobacteraceae bacterium]